MVTLFRKKVWEEERHLLYAAVHRGGGRKGVWGYLSPWSPVHFGRDAVLGADFLVIPCASWEGIVSRS